MTRKLRRLGCEFDRQASRSHENWRNPRTRTRATVPNWGPKDLRPGTIRAIVRDLGLDWSEFRRA
ncbi:MAG: type II toxin-antitoxin system HicA family toxin [Chloroflexota bacterium]|nr:type II toxin-antitoxin system HicA family toxin [Chloroflexota bacterium]